MAELDESLVAKFNAVCREMEVEDFSTSSAIMSRRIADPQEMEAFHQWMMAGCRPRYAAPLNFLLTAEEFVGQVESMNFLSKRACDNLIQFKGMATITIPIGFNGRILYRLETSHGPLRPHSRKNKTIARPSSDSLLDTCFLGVNVTVQPANPPGNHRRANLSQRSTRSVESTEAEVDAPGFVFFKLGHLTYHIRKEGQQGPWRKQDDKGSYDSPWQRTGFGLVVRLTPSGYADGVYAIYDMHDDINRNPVDDYPPPGSLLSHCCWGHMPTFDPVPREQFSCAKLGPRLSSLGKNHQLVMTDLIEHPVELVGVKRLADGRIVRTTVDEKSWPSAVGGGGGMEEGGK